MNFPKSLGSLINLRQSKEKEFFFRIWADSDLEVQKRAVWCLGMIKSAKEIEKMMGILKQISSPLSPKCEQLETQIYHAFGTSGNLTIEGKTLEEFLLNVIEQRGIRRWFGLFEKNPLPDAALGAICDALGNIGTNESVKTLTHLGKSRDGPWIPKVKEALKKIEERTRPQAPNATHEITK